MHAVTKANSARKSTVPIQHVPITVFVRKEFAFAKKAGRDLIVQLRIKQPFHAYQLAQITENSIHTPKSASVMQNSAVMTAHWSFVTSLVVHMDVVLMTNVNATRAGMVNFVIQNYVMHAAMTMDNVRMAHVYVLPDGMESIVPSRDVLLGKLLLH